MYPVSVRLDEEHVESLEMALAALNAERATCERWGSVTTRHALAIDDIEEILDRADRAEKGNGTTAGSLTSLIGRSKPW